MNFFAVALMLVNAVALLIVPRRWAALPLLAGACYVTNAQNIELGPFHFTVLRLLIVIGVLRAIVLREHIQGSFVGLDWIWLLWGIWLIFSGLFHTPFDDAVVFRLGIVFNAYGLYFLIRIFCRDTNDLSQTIRLTAFILVPIALEMIYEKLSARNAFAFLGGVPAEVMERDGKLRAQGPFAHPILAGTVGGICVPLMLALWHQYSRAAKIGLLACLVIIAASKSSGPLMTTFTGVAAVTLWHWRRSTRKLLVAAALLYIAIGLFSSRPTYYVLLNRIDLTGSSTGWHRAELIKQSINHFDEWWFSGTDYTRHWMPTGVTWNANHTDITNHYLLYGVWAGMPLMLLFIVGLCLAFRYVGETIRLRAYSPNNQQFIIWCLGASLFAYAVTSISVAFFDQSATFLYLIMATIASLRATTLSVPDGMLANQAFTRTTEGWAPRQSLRRDGPSR